jgi:hypothetical protein
MVLRPWMPASVLLLFCACMGDPNENPLVDVEPICGAASQNDRYFGAAFTRENESAREQLESAYLLLSDHSEPSLACGNEPDEAYRLTALSDFPNAPLIIRVERSGDQAMIRATVPRYEPGRGIVSERVDRVLAADEWGQVAAAANAVDVLAMRALLTRHHDSYRMFLYEFRRRGTYALAMRPATGIHNPATLNAFISHLISLAGYDYPWG